MTILDEVKEWLEERELEGEEKEDTDKQALKELIDHGCQSGIVSDLIYYHDTSKFYQRNKQEIGVLLADLLDNCGCTIHQLFRDWDQLDPLANDTHNQNLLAWFSFEETAMRYSNELRFNL
tara:strand:+ start:238 stop:600 length:363 start_codon:yes stop_codon:yes gene_type:complete